MSSVYRVRYLGGFCTLYGREYYTSLGWYEVNETTYMSVRNAPDWEVEGEELSTEEETVEEEVEELVEEVVEETAEEAEEELEEEAEESDEVDLTTLSKKELQALCDERELKYKSLDNKAALILLLGSDEEE